jgi:hypothetical protein
VCCPRTHGEGLTKWEMQVTLCHAKSHGKDVTVEGGARQREVHGKGQSLCRAMVHSKGPSLCRGKVHGKGSYRDPPAASSRPRRRQLLFCAAKGSKAHGKDTFAVPIFAVRSLSCKPARQSLCRALLRLCHALRATWQSIEFL